MDRTAADTALVVPDLGLQADEPITLSVWLVSLGEAVSAGDRVVELLAGEMTVDLPSPCAGELVRRLIAVDEPVTPGTVLGYVRAPAHR